MKKPLKELKADWAMARAEVETAHKLASAAEIAFTRQWKEETSMELVHQCPNCKTWYIDLESAWFCCPIHIEYRCTVCGERQDQPNPCEVCATVAAVEKKKEQI